MSTVLELYQSIIKEVISTVRESFFEDGVDEEVLQNLQQSWESKLTADTAVNNQRNIGTPQEEIVHQDSNQINTITPQQVMAPDNHLKTEVIEMAPISIQLPSKQGTNEPPRILNILIPKRALQENQLRSILTSSILTAAMELPATVASYVLQQHVNAVFKELAEKGNAADAIINTTTTVSIVQNDGAHEDIELKILFNSQTKKVKQLDGSEDSPNDESFNNFENDDSSYNNKDEQGVEEEPLNSEDDLADADLVDFSDTDNVVICQYSKISRNRSNWKIHLKNGIMNLNGKDFVFQKANGDAVW